MSERVHSRQKTHLVLGTLIAIYAYSRILQTFPGRASILEIVALHVLPPLLFALIHGTILYRLRGSLAFIVMCLVVGNIFENLGVRTGFPYGRYYFTAVMGPKIFAVPIFLGLAYIGMAYLSWTLARIILKNFQTPLAGPSVVAIPVVAAFIMVGWDLAMDPVWSTIVHAWIWQRGGSYFGVPLTNFLGWYLVVYIIYQIFALYLRRQPPNSQPLPPSFWRLPIIFYAVSAAGNLILLIPHHRIASISDPVGVQWNVSSILTACGFVSIFIIGGFAALAWLRLKPSTVATPAALAENQ